jgi:hypothetical protein
MAVVAEELRAAKYRHMTDPDPLTELWRGMSEESRLAILGRVEARNRGASCQHPSASRRNAGQAARGLLWPRSVYNNPKSVRD